MTLGEDALPVRWLDRLELKGVITQVADDLADTAEGRMVVFENGMPEAAPGWWKRYPGC